MFFENRKAAKIIPAAINGFKISAKPKPSWSLAQRIIIS
jgi:hypothetical protein